MGADKEHIVVATRELSSSNCSTLGNDAEGDTKEGAEHNVLKLRNTQQTRTEPRITALGKGKELIGFSYGCARTYLSDLPTRHRSRSKQGDFVHYVVQPWYEWFGRNKRITTTPSLNTIRLMSSSQSHEDDTLINGGSFNYAGMYSMPAGYEELHRMCLQTLPIMGRDTPLIEQALRKEVMEFWNVDCCYTTPTGYQSNILALPAILDADWLVLMDEKSHSSIITAARLADVGDRFRFKHNDMHELEQLLKVAATKQYSNVMVVVEGLYSLDGNLPDLGGLNRLKARYNFVLLCDEAHSFLSIGTTGRGCQEWWNDTHKSDSVPEDLIDIRTTTLSKAIGGVGGLVCAKQQFSERLKSRDAELRTQGESLSTPAMLQALDELKRAGVVVYGESTMPILPVHGGRPTKASRLSYELRKHGVAATPFSKPAVPMWQSRVRIGMSAEFTDVQVDTLVEAIVQSCAAAGISKDAVGHTSRHSFAQYLRGSTLHVSPYGLELEKQTVLDSLSKLLASQRTSCYAPTPGCEASITSLTRSTGAVRKAGHKARHEFGLGSGSSRWILGTYPTHLEVEALICTATKQTAAMTYTNTEAGLMSTTAALLRPIKGRRTHLLLRPADASQAIVDGFAISRQNRTTRHAVYDGLDIMLQMVKSALCSSSHITLIIDLAHTPEDHLSAVAQHLKQWRGNMKQVTIFLANVNIARMCTTTTSCNVTDFMALLGTRAANVLLFGSFYNTFGLNGAFLAGDKAIIEELRYSSRCYVFTAAPAPYMMAMVSAAIAQHLRLLPSQVVSTKLLGAEAE
ncbi:hypothetical protein LTR62_001500 [Meristemomyces frigidus]|uniref:Aminotransferase class I/classII large domain-containing protein n=1 Tax=Meristemomyces frigidus TaxID=1508187 RepID=A0AAN7TN38_9PEZI|nr:hypothetical protein LTR62_001500 [Meristemomyces frigidus]